jgi:hypothetical protein
MSRRFIDLLDVRMNASGDAKEIDEQTVAIYKCCFGFHLQIHGKYDQCRRRALLVNLIRIISCTLGKRGKVKILAKGSTNPNSSTYKKKLPADRGMLQSHSGPNLVSSESHTKSKHLSRLVWVGILHTSS